MTHTADRLIDGLKRRGVVPASQSLYQDSDILAMADDLIEGTIVPLITSLREDYFVVKTITPIVSGTFEYDIPYRAVGRILREIKVVGSAVESSTTTKRRLTRMSLGDEHIYHSSATPQAFYLRGDKIALVPTPMSSDLLLELWWHMRPNRLTVTSSCAQVQSISMDTVTCVSVPTTMTASTLVDFIQGVQGCTTLDYDIAISNVSGNQIAFVTDAVPSTLQAGDWISLAQTSPVIQLPDEAYALLETYLAQRILIGLGDIEGAQILNDAVGREEKLLKGLLEPRVIGEPKKIINRSGLLRGQRSRYRYGWVWR